MKKILCFIDSLGSGGAQRQLVGLAVMLRQRGYDVKVTYYHNYPFYKEILDTNNVDNELIPEANNIFKRIPVIFRYFKHENPNWVIAYQETPSLIASFVKLLGCKYYLITSERNTTQKITISDRIRFFLYRWADFIVPNSYSQGLILKEYKPIFSNKINVITNFIDFNKFLYYEHSRHDIPFILVVGRVSPQKNTLNLIKAASVLKSKGIPFIIKWYGLTDATSQYEETCRKLIEEYGLNNIFHLLPKTSEIELKYRDCDYFCLPSLYEGTPNVIGEAMASGVPIVCSEVCDNQIYVKDGQNGILFDPLNINSIVSAIQRLLETNEEEYRRYCKMSRYLAEELFSSSKFLQKYELLIQSK